MPNSIDRAGICWLDLTLADLAANLALDEALLLEAEAGGPEVLRFWEWSAPAVVLGAGGRWSDEVHCAACARDGVPIARRSSGGGAVVLGPGCLVYSLVLAMDRVPALADLHASYRCILGTLVAALAPLAPGIRCAGLSDLALGDRKVSGNSQQRKRTHLLHHGTLLCSLDLELLERYLAYPPREPAYRRGRGHAEFVTNLQITPTIAKERFSAAWAAKVELVSWPQDTVNRLLHDKYGRVQWLRRR
ncbi:MAG: lipoate--protein ligase family protein [Gemmataceae bacterium]|nr:lipoate--protein ligase family protein [Gemmataceae bacterium]